MPLERSPPRTGPDVPCAQQADVPRNASLLQRHDLKRASSCPSQLLNVGRCDNQLNPPGRVVDVRVSQGNRSSRGIERKCREDVAYRVIAANLVPDHSTIAEFRARHEAALAGLFGEVLGLCREAGLVRVGVIVVDGTKVHANASNMANMDYRQIAEANLKDAARIDREEDELYGEKRGDEVPLELSTHNGRREWLREAKRRLDEKRERDAKPVLRSRPKRLREAKDRLQEELWAEQHANASYEAWRGRGISADGARRMAPGTVKPYVPPEVPAGKVNITDPDSRNLKAFRGYVQGYDDQAVVTEDQVVIAAEIKTGR